MNDYILFMHDDTSDGQRNRAEQWAAYFAKLRRAGAFQGGSSIGDGVCASKSASAPGITRHLSGLGYTGGRSSSIRWAALGGRGIERSAIESGTDGRAVKLETTREPITLDTARVAVLVVDMQNDFGSKGGMFDRAGIDISAVRDAIAPTIRALDAARRAGMPVVYLKMGYQDDLSDLGPAGSPNRERHLNVFSVGAEVTAPDGRPSRVLIRDTWNTDVLDELKPHPVDLVIYKNRFSGFHETELDAILRSRGVNWLIVTGVSTSVCVESTIRDAMFRDYSCVLLADCTAEPIGSDLPRTNHEASILLIQTLFGWVSSSVEFVRALGPNDR